MNKEELNNLKTRIDLIQFIAHHGYQHDRRMSDRTRTAMKKGNKLLFVTTNQTNGQQIYINCYETDQKGSIIDFLMNEKNITVKESIETLQGYLETHPATENEAIPSKTLETNQERSLPIKISEDHFKMDKLIDTEYLRSRHISMKTVNSKTFKGTIGNKDRTITTSTNKKFKITNTAFPIKNAAGETIGLELKGSYFNRKTGMTKTFKGMLEHSNKKEGLYYSNIPDKSQHIIESIIIAENPIDLLAQYQLNKQDNEIIKNIYIATEGHITTEQIREINNIIKKNNPQNIILANDNDISGKRFNMTLLGQLDYPKKLNQNIQFKIESFNKETSQLIIKGKKNEANSLREIGYIKDYFQRTKFETKILPEEDKIMVMIPNNKEAFNRCYKIMENTIFYGKKQDSVRICEPQNKDFAEDLEVQMGKNSIKQNE